MKPNPQGRRLDARPKRRDRRIIRASEKYQKIRRGLDTTDDETMLLTRLGDLYEVAEGQRLNGQPWSRTYAVVGLDVALRVGNVRSSAPWVVRDVAKADAELVVTGTGSVLVIDRRHLHLVDRTMAGRAEPVDPIAKANKETGRSRPQPGAVHESATEVHSVI